MANYNATARSNYFRVAPEKQADFDALVDKFGLDVVRKDDGTVAVFPGDFTDDGTFPSTDPDTDEDFRFQDKLAPLLAEGSVAILVESGAEKQRYVYGGAVAFDRSGIDVSISISDIVGLALKTFPGCEVSEPTY